MANPERLLVIGIDAADHGAVTDWAQRGVLPHWSELVARGALFPCRSTTPAHSAPAWTTMQTGCRPAKHGLYDFLDHSTPIRQPWWLSPRRCPSLWRRLSEAGLSCGVLNVPMTYPAEEINGVMVSGYGSPSLSEQSCFPPELRQELLESLPEYDLQPDIAPGRWPGADVLAHYARMQCEAAKLLLARQPFDVFMVVLNSLDWAGHGHWCEQRDGQGVPLEVMREIDHQLGELVALCDWPRTPVAVVSDHGLQCARRQVNLPRLFTQLGLMQVRRDSEEGGRQQTRASALIRAWNAAKRVLPPGVITCLRRWGHDRRSAVLESAPGAHVDWAQSLAVPIGQFGCVRLSVRGRDPGGTIEPHRYEAARDDVVQRLGEIVDPANGKPLFRHVSHGVELPDASPNHRGPDLVLQLADDDMTFGGPTTDADLLVFMEQKELVAELVPPCGIHGDLGVFLVSGEQIGASHPVGECSLEEVAPTILRLVGLPVPSYMDGRALPALFGDGTGDYDAAVVDESLPMPEEAPLARTSAEQEQLKEKLRGLGYL